MNSADLQALAQPLQRPCPLMLAQGHCWHEQMRLWDDPFPPAMVCCWCGEATDDMAAVPHRHGPHAPTVK